MSELRKLLIQQVTELGRPLAAVCREHGVSRKTGYKWLARYRLAPVASLAHRSRRPRATARRIADALERQVLDVRQKFAWGARKIRAYLAARGVSLPSVATVNAILRQGQIAAAPQPEDGDWQRLIRSQPDELWQCHHKGPLEVGRQKVFPLSVIDDHSRFLLALDPSLSRPDDEDRVWRVVERVWRVRLAGQRPLRQRLRHEFYRAQDAQLVRCAHGSPGRATANIAGRIIRRRKAKSSVFTARWCGNYGLPCVATSRLTASKIVDISGRKSTTWCGRTRACKTNHRPRSIGLCGDATRAPAQN